MQGQLSVKADVYSFGVLLLEIMSGRKISDVNIPYEMENLLEWAWKLYKGDDVKNLVDPTVAETCPQEKAGRFIQVGLLCVQLDATLRPTMSSVIVMISSNSVRLANPQRPAFISKSKSHGPKARGKFNSESGAGSYETETSGTMTSSSSGIASVNDASITQVNPR